MTRATDRIHSAPAPHRRRTRRPRRGPVLAAAALAGALALTGCAAGSGDAGGTTAPTGGGTVAAGEPITCANVGGELQRLGDDVQAAVERVSTDPEAVVAELGAIAERLGGLVEATEDAQLREHLQTAQAAAGAFIETAGTALRDGDLLGSLGELGRQLDDLRTALGDAEAHCRTA